LETKAPWDLDLPDDLPDHFARTIELCFSPDATHGHVQKVASDGVRGEADRIARAIELCLSPDAIYGQVQKGLSGGEGSAIGGSLSDIVAALLANIEAVLPLKGTASVTLASSPSCVSDCIGVM
jgi:hypothetical protein